MTFCFVFPCSTTYITCPADPKKTLGIKLPFLVMIIKNLKKYFTFEVQVSVWYELILFVVVAFILCSTILTFNILTDNKTLKLVQVKTNCRQHFKVHL